VRLAGRSRVVVLLTALFAASACHRGTQEDINLMTGRCSTRLHAKGVAPRLPVAPTLRPGLGGVVGTLADSGGALPHYSILATAPGDSPDAPHATTQADSVGGFVFAALIPGTYRLFVRAFAHKPDSVQLDVAAGRIDTVRLRPQFFECVR
jgi:hypothetical protein